MIVAHKGQSMLLGCFNSSPLPSRLTILIPPPVAQTICMLPGLIKAEATAEPKKSPNHTSTKLAISFELLSLCIRILWHLQFKCFHLLLFVKLSQNIFCEGLKFFFD
jgi:hypothetical protein